MVYICVAIGIVLITVVLSPFLLGSGGMLAPGSQVNSKAQLDALKVALLKRYLEDEAAHKSGMLSKLAWEQRKTFLVNRYIDAARRHDYLNHVNERPDASQQGESAQASAKDSDQGVS